MAYGNYTQVLHVFCRELRQDWTAPRFDRTGSVAR